MLRLVDGTIRRDILISIRIAFGYLRQVPLSQSGRDE